MADVSRQKALSEVLDVLSKEEKELFQSYQNLSDAGSKAAEERLVRMNQTSLLKEKVRILLAKEL